MKIYPGMKLKVVVRRDEDTDLNNGSIIYEQRPGMVYAIAKAPRYESDEDWQHNAELICRLIEENGETQ